MRRGAADRVLVGAVDEMSPLLHATLDRFGALAKAGADGIEQGRPFDVRANGWLGADGAAVILLEREEEVRKRGGSFRSRLVGAGTAFDPGAPRSGWGKAPGPRVEALRAFLAHHGVGSIGIDRIVCSAGGLQEADRLEAKLIRQAVGNSPIPPILAPAATAGSHGGALLAGAVIAADGAPFGPTPGFAVADEEARIVPYDGRPLGDPKMVLVTACAPGGSAGWALLERSAP